MTLAWLDLVCFSFCGIFEGFVSLFWLGCFVVLVFFALVLVGWLAGFLQVSIL